MSDDTGHGGDPLMLELVCNGGAFVDGAGCRSLEECWEVAIKTAGDPDICFASAFGKAAAVDRAIFRAENMLEGLRDLKAKIAR